MEIMPEALLMSVDEYLHKRFRPDCDFVDGVVQERNLGERDHSSLRGALVAIFYHNRAKLDDRGFAGAAGSGVGKSVPDSRPLHPTEGRPQRSDRANSPADLHRGSAPGGYSETAQARVGLHRVRGREHLGG